MKLRDYQAECLDAVWDNMVKGSKTSLVSIPCGSGKTVIFNELISRAIKSKSDLKACVLFNRVDLLDQQTDRMRNYLKKDIVGQWCGSLGKHDSHQILMSSIQSIYDEDHYFDLIIVDETHNLDDSSGKYFDFLSKKLILNPKTKIVGFTATPYRYDGYIYGRDRLFKEITYKKDLEWFIDNGFLVPLISKQPDYVFDVSKLKVVAGEYSASSVDSLVNGDESFIKSQIADALARADGRKKIVWQCANIDHAETVNRLLTEVFSESSVSVHSRQDADSKGLSLDLFENGKARHLTFVSIVSEGYDYPPIDCIVLMRPTRSAVLYVQTVGRGMRTSEGKEDCLVLDYADVVMSLGPVSDPIIDKKFKGKKNEEAPVKVCATCKSHNKLTATNCVTCNTEFPKPKPPVDKMRLKADENNRLLGAKPDKTLEIGKVLKYEYTSRNGNNCYVIEYRPNGFDFSYGAGIKEYFVKDNEWAIARYEKRLVELSMNPTHIVYEMDGKYAKVKKLLFKEMI